MQSTAIYKNLCGDTKFLHAPETMKNLFEGNPSLKETIYMCGIVGCIGDNRIQTVILDGLEKLEYRGYDSAGLFIADADGTTQLVKK